MATKKKVNKTVPEKTKKLSATAEVVKFLTPMIEKGTSTKAELVEKAGKKFPDYKVVTLNTLLYDSKNEKYNRFQKLVTVTKEGHYAFKGAKK